MAKQAYQRNASCSLRQRSGGHGDRADRAQQGRAEKEEEGSSRFGSAAWFDLFIDSGVQVINEPAC